MFLSIFIRRIIPPNGYARGFVDEFQGQSFEVQYDDKNQTARIVGENGDEWPTLISFWFAWYAFHPDTEIYEAVSK